MIEVRTRRRTLLIAAITGIALLAFLIGLTVGDRGNGGTTASGGASPAATTWTCSMHPQIKLPKPGQCPICFMDLIPLATSSGDDLGPRQLRMSESARKLAQIQTAPVVRGRADAELRLLGKLVYDETRLARITARVSGRLEKLYANFTGQSIRAGEPLVDIYAPELASAENELVQALRSLEDVAKSESAILKSTAAATVEGARSKLQLLGLSAEQIAEIESTRDAKSVITIESPISGVIAERMAQVGQTIEMGMDLYAIADPQRLWLIVDAYESDIAQLKAGREVAFSTPSYPGERFSARIDFVSPAVDPMTRTVAVRAAVENSSLRLKPEMFASVTAGVSQTAGEQLIIPATAPLLTGKRAVVYVELENAAGPLFEGREVALGPRTGDFYVVESGLNEGELVVVNGAFKIDSELQINAKPSLMSMDGGGVTMGGHQHGAVAVPVAERISAQARVELTPVYDAYFSLQMALAHDDLPAATKLYQKLSDAVDAVRMTAFTGAHHGSWMKLAAEVKEHSERGAATGDDAQLRDAFFFVSKAMIDMHKQFGHADGRNFYLTFCPMARNNQGAYWLQTTDTIWNSYYGDKMLRCGEVRDTLPPTAGE